MRHSSEEGVIHVRQRRGEQRRGAGRVELRVIEQIEKLGAEEDSLSLRDLGGLLKGHIKVELARPFCDPRTRVAEIESVSNGQGRTA